MKNKNPLREVNWLFDRIREFNSRGYEEIARLCATKAKEEIEKLIPSGPPGRVGLPRSKHV